MAKPNKTEGEGAGKQGKGFCGSSHG